MSDEEGGGSDFSVCDAEDDVCCPTSELSLLHCLE